MNTEQVVLNHISSFLKPRNLSLQMKLKDDLGLDSILFIAMLSSIGDELKMDVFSIDIDDLMDIISVGDFVNVLNKYRFN